MCDEKEPIKPALRGMELSALEAYITGLGEKRFRAAQLYEWLHRRLAADFSEMTNLSKGLRAMLDAACTIALPEPVRVQTSRLDDTQKFLFRLRDDRVVETVLMRHDYGWSVCISSQVGCAMGCAFCASTIGGHERNLTTDELLGQVYAIQRILWNESDPAPSGTDTLPRSAGAGEAARISHIVVMGTGEPLLNYDNLLAFIRLIGSERGLHISKRNITISTCGIVPKMRTLAEADLPVTLAVSLHAPTQRLREQLMPIARQYPMAELLAACRQYYDHTGRRVTLEYAMIRGINDTPDMARTLASLAASVRAHVNLIPLNEIAESAFAPSSAETIRRFASILQRQGVNATVRRSMGADIDGACGQLRKAHLSDHRQ